VDFITKLAVTRQGNNGNHLHGCIDKTNPLATTENKLLQRSLHNYSWMHMSDFMDTHYRLRLGCSVMEEEDTLAACLWNWANHRLGEKDMCVGRVEVLGDPRIREGQQPACL